MSSKKELANEPKKNMYHEVVSKVMISLEAKKSEELVLLRLRELQRQLKPSVWKK